MRARNYVLGFLVTSIMIVFLGFGGMVHAQSSNAASELNYLIAQADAAKANAETCLLLVGSEGSDSEGGSGLLAVASAYATENRMQSYQYPLITEAISFKNEALNQMVLGDQHLQKAKDREVESQARRNHALQAAVNFGNAIVQFQKAETDLWQFLPNKYQLSAACAEITAAGFDIGETGLYLDYDLTIVKGIPSSKLEKADDVLNDARSKASKSEVEFTSGDYSKATTDAIEARTLAKEAYIKGKEIETEWNVISQLDGSTSTAISNADDSIKEVGAFLAQLTIAGHDGNGTRQAYAILEQARGTLQNSRTNFTATNYSQALDYATQANNMAWQAKETALSDFEIPSPAPSRLPWILFGVFAFLVPVGIYGSIVGTKMYYKVESVKKDRDKFKTEKDDLEIRVGLFLQLARLASDLRDAIYYQNQDTSYNTIPQKEGLLKNMEQLLTRLGFDSKQNGPGDNTGSF